MRQSKLLDPNSLLPSPDSKAHSRSEKLSVYIKKMIDRHGGSIGFDEYMDLALYQKDLGYYSSGNQKFGPRGDFVTAPEISPLFSKCLASQCAQILGDFEDPCILEIGAGTGVMAKDLLLVLEKSNLLPEKYFIFEISPDLKLKQQKLLKQSIPRYIDRIIWIDSLPERKFNGLVLANEVLDALPVKRFKKESDLFKEVKVSFTGNEFYWVDAPANHELTNALEKIEDKLLKPFPENYCSEININLKIWLDSVQSVMRKGVILFIDYGYSMSDYYHPERSDGNLLCHYKHHIHDDPFFYPGLQDITTSVDFTSVAKNAEEVGLNISGYTNQLYFLISCGLDDLVPDMSLLNTKSQTQISKELRTLLMPDEMGERFKFMALTKKYNKELLGFSKIDQRNQL